MVLRATQGSDVAERVTTYKAALHSTLCVGQRVRFKHIKQ